MRRDKNDLKWQDCKNRVYEIDKNQCLLCQSLSVAEDLAYKESVKDQLVINKIDPAHHLPVSLRPDIMYKVSNVFCLCRTHHTRLDSNQNPITGKYCSSEETKYWWSRIIKQREKNNNPEQLADLPTFEYDEL